MKLCHCKAVRRNCIRGHR